MATLLVRVHSARERGNAGEEDIAPAEAKATKADKEADETPASLIDQ